jgi:hypothetical protein
MCKSLTVPIFAKTSRFGKLDVAVPLLQNQSIAQRS